MPLPLDPWHAWYESQPENDDSANCAVITNFKYWAVNKMNLQTYAWLDYPCQHTGDKDIQGYICESKG